MLEHWSPRLSSVCFHLAFLSLNLSLNLVLMQEHTQKENVLQTSLHYLMCILCFQSDSRSCTSFHIHFIQFLHDEGPKCVTFCLKRELQTWVQLHGFSMKDPISTTFESTVHAWTSACLDFLVFQSLAGHPSDGSLVCQTVHREALGEASVFFS